VEVACRLVDDLAQLVAGGEVVDGRRTRLCQLSGSGNICERAILVSGNMCILTVLKSGPGRPLSAVKTGFWEREKKLLLSSATSQKQSLRKNL
jgi:hypothetical protein